MTLKEALKWGTSELHNAGVDSPELDAELLLLHAFHSPIRANWRMNRSLLYAHPEQTIKPRALVRYKKFIARRARREPVAYILGHKEFYGLDFLVDRRVLIPRPESELMVEQAFRGIMNYESRIRNIAVIDVGTGNGAIIVALVKQYSLSEARTQSKGSRLRPMTFARTIKFFATDISPAALRVARTNARRHGVDNQIKFLHGNLLEPIIRNFLNSQSRNFIITANLPYLLTSEWRATAPEIKKWEPRGALDGGRDGLKYYSELFKQLYQFMSSRGLRPGSEDVAISHHGKRLPRSLRSLTMTAMVETCPEQVIPFQCMVRRYFLRAKFRVIKDLAGKNRVVIARL